MDRVPFPAGWALRRWRLDEFIALVETCQPSLVEISKDFLRDDVSLKGLARALSSVRAPGAALAYAGTTDLVACDGLPWTRYRAYVAVQIAQAKFLDCSRFRFFVGTGSSTPLPVVLDRVRALCADIAPMEACIEIHGGFECTPGHLAALLQDTPVQVVVDFENMHHAGLTSDGLRERLPRQRIAYFHHRNLRGVWTEHAASLQDEACWHAWVPDGDFLWEPKTVDDPRRIRELLDEYRTSH
jgi:hypothetical protein